MEIVHYLNQVCRPAHAWFLKIASVQTSVCVFVCVSAPEATNNQWRDVAQYGPHTIG